MASTPPDQERTRLPDITIESALAAVETAKQAAAKLENLEFNNGYQTNISSAGATVRRRSGESFNISTFKAEVTNSDSILPTHSFLVVFAPMRWVDDFPSAVRQQINSVLTMRCDNAILPAMNLLQEQNIRRYGFGPVENVAYGVNVGDFTLQFIVDRGALVVDFFEAWMNRIVNRESYGGANMNNDVGRGKTPYEVAYKDTYACPSVNVFFYDRAQNSVMEYNIYDVFPTGIQSMNMSWGEENTMMKLNVTFSFTDFRIRPKTSFFGQSVAEAPNRPTSPVITKMLEDGDKPLVDTSKLAQEAELAVADLSNQTVVIGDSPRVSRQSVSLPRDTAANPATTPEVSIPVTRNAFGSLTAT